MRKNKNFIIKLVSAVVIVAVLFYYQSVARVRAEIVSANEAKIAEIEAHNAKVLSAMSESPYSDGTYTGEGIGFGGTVKVMVTIEDGRISSVEVTEHGGEDPAYFSQAQSLTFEVVKRQTWEIDTVSGATFSSKGILDAAGDALSKAVK